MKKRGTGLFFLIFLCLLTIPRQLVVAQRLDLQAGLGYDFLSQRYFLDSATLGGVDSAFINWQLSSTYLDDFKGQFSLLYEPFSDNSLRIKTSFEQTIDFLRLKTLSEWHLRSGKTRLDMSGELEWRNRLNDSVQFGDSYIYGYGRVKLSTPVYQSLSGVVMLKAEHVDFRTSSVSTYDYRRLTGQFGFEKTFDNFSFASLSAFITSREVPDSSLLDYLTIGVEASFFGPAMVGDLDLSVRFESKNYNQPNHQNDQQRLELYGYNRINLGGNWFTRQELTFEAALYNPDDLISSNYMRLGLALLAGQDINGITLSAGPKIEILDEQDSEYSVGEDYFETGAKLELEFMHSVAYFGSVESTFGYRDLRFENDLQTNFLFERLNLVADIKVLSVLRLNVIFGAEWEWHKLRQDNSELYLLSSNITYSF